MKSNKTVYNKLVYFLMVWTILQEFVLGVLYHFIHIAPIIKVLFYSKDVLLVVLFIVSFFRCKMPAKFVALQLWYLLFVVLGIFVSIFTNSLSMMTIISSTRGLILLPAFLTIGYSVKESDLFLEKIKTQYMFILVCVAFFGIIDYVLDVTVGTRNFWIGFVQIGSYMTDIKNSGHVVYNGLPGNFYTYSKLGPFTQKRLVSFWAHPLTSGYCLVLPVVYYSIMLILRNKEKQFRWKEWIKFILVFAALILTYTRATILPTLLLILLCMLYRYKSNGEKLVLVLAGFLMAGILGIVFWWDKFFGYIYNGSTLAHINSLTGSLKHINVWGRGVGLFSAATKEGIWTESTYLSVVGQLGVIAAILYIVMFLLPIFKIMKNHKNKNTLVVAIAATGCVLFITGFVSEQLTAYTAIAPYYILAGCAMRTGVGVDRCNDGGLC